ncbi:MAG: phage minor capsid protein [Faecousia sp.]
MTNNGIRNRKIHAEYENLNNSLVRRIGTLNCGHAAFPIILGVDSPQYTKDELEEMRRENEKGIDYNGRHYTMYEATQRQRKLERAIRKQKRRILAAEQNPDDKERLQQAQIKYQVLNQEYKRFSKAAGLRLQHERMETSGFGPKQAMAAEKAASMAEKENLVNENSPRPKKNADYAVDWEIVQSEEYSNRFDKLSSSERANSAVRTRAKWALNNRDGAKTEELYAIDMRNGSEIARITDQHYQQGVKRTEQFEKAIGLAEKTGAEIMLIHNHPAGSPPSIGDLNALLSTPNAQGITVGHNGSIYRYTAPKKKIPQADFEVAYRKNSVYTDITAYEKALEELRMVYGFTFERL